MISSKDELAAILAEMQRRRYLVDPALWIGERLGESVWSRQQKVLQSMVANPRTAVKSCHGSGKSWVAARAVAWWIDVHPPGEAFVVTSAPTGRQVRAILWREVGRAFAHGNLMGRLNQTEWWLTIPGGAREELVAFGQKPADMDPTAFQGIHAPYVLVVLDEACGIPGSLWTAADSLAINSDCRQLAIGNPDDPSSEFYNVCKPGSGWNVITISAFDTPLLTGEPVNESARRALVSKEWVEDKKKRWGESNPLYISKVNGEFPEVSQDGLIPIKWIREAQERELTPGTPVELGIDVGGGQDKSTVCLRRGPVARIIRRSTNPDTMQTLGAAIRDLEQNGATQAKIDNIGIGKGAADRALELGKPIIGVNVGEGAADGTAFANLKAEIFWQLREVFQNGEIDLDPADEDLAAQLAALRYKVTSSGKILMESKKEMRKREGRSPDDADALALAFYKPKVEQNQSPIWGRG